MLTLTIKKKWFDMILSGEKKEEYREIKPYYESRVMNEFGIIVCDGEYLKCSDIGLSECERDEIQTIRFRNGYSKTSPSFIAKCTLSVGTGKEEWGAEKDKEYFILKIVEIVKENDNVLMHDKEAKKFRKLLKTMPKEHPFEHAELCELYCYDDTPTYVTSPAYDAFTYPTYDRDSQSFLYRHYDMEAETSDDVRVDLIELLEAHIDDDFVRAIEICNMFNVPMTDIKACQEEVLKM